MAIHKQTWAKVNAPVDEGVKDLVEALSAFPKLQTIESCQGDGEGQWVGFWYGDGDCRELADFVLGFLAPTLHKEVGDGVVISIQIDSAGVPQGDLLVRPGALRRTLRAIRTASYPRP